MVAIAGMICTLIFVSVMTGKRLKVAGAMMLLLVVLACVVVTFADELRLDALLNGNVTEGSNGRMEGYAVAMELFMNSPLLASVRQMRTWKGTVLDTTKFITQS
ncbi:hypothetical protein AWV79_05555 [Cupriavidus sp. UYMMa02A]|nr:hypothetical protein AWV79_05555 [Cupriavidus sp. UYMMa02A]